MAKNIGEFYGKSKSKGLTNMDGCPASTAADAKVTATSSASPVFVPAAAVIAVAIATTTATISATLVGV